MKKEKTILSFIAVLIGLLVAGIAFYFYQTTKTISDTKTNTVSIKPSPIPTINESAMYLNIDTPQDEAVVDKKILTISGKTIKDATIVVLTNSSDDVINTASNGNFSTTVNLEDGENQISITAISPTGEEETVIKTVTYSTESF